MPSTELRQNNAIGPARQRAGLASDSRRYFQSAGPISCAFSCVCRRSSAQTFSFVPSAANGAEANCWGGHEL